MSEDLTKDADQLSELYRQIPQQEPPAHLDAAILQAAKANTEQAAVPKRSLRLWTLPASMAALLVLGVGVVRLTIQEMPQTIHPTASPTPSAGRSEQSLEAGKVEQKARTLNELPSPADSRLRAAEPMLQDADEGSLNQPVPKSAAQPSRLESFSDEQEKRSIFRENVRQQRDQARAPEEWLEEIAELRRQGHDARAQASWMAFRQSYPDFPVDETLQQQFEQP